MAGLYIHIPFCGQRCAYCDFYSQTDQTRIAGFVGALKREMEARKNFLPTPKLDTIYIGGGTPSLLSSEQLRGLLDRAAELWDCTSLKEVTLEANPEDLTDSRNGSSTECRPSSQTVEASCERDNADGGLLSDLMRIGFNRLSIGVQSFDDGLLRLMNRRHSAARAKEAVRAAQDAGFGNITIDLIYGTPGMTHEGWERTLDEAVELGVQHISAYHLTIEPGTPFGRRRLRPIPEAESERQYGTLWRKLSDAGFEHYEISNFALSGRRAVHNSAYWSGEPYLGVGPSAHSFDGARRREWVASDLDRYIAEAGTETDAGTDALYEGETLDDGELFNERIMTSLRTADGLDLAAAAQRFGAGRVERLRQMAEKFLADGLLVQTSLPPTLRIPPEKFLLSDWLISSLFDDGS